MKLYTWPAFAFYVNDIVVNKKIFTKKYLQKYIYIKWRRDFSLK